MLRIRLGGTAMADHPNTNGSGSNGNHRIRMSESEWEKMCQETMLPVEEVERILREEPMIDASEVNRLLGITDEEIADAMNAPSQEIFPPLRKTRDSE